MMFVRPGWWTRLSKIQHLSLHLPNLEVRICFLCNIEDLKKKVNLLVIYGLHYSILAATKQAQHGISLGKKYNIYNYIKLYCFQTIMWARKGVESPRILNTKFVHDHPSFSTTKSTRFGPTDFILLEGNCYKANTQTTSTTFKLTTNQPLWTRFTKRMCLKFPRHPNMFCSRNNLGLWS